MKIGFPLVLAAVSLLGCAQQATSPPAATDLKNYQPLFENELVRVGRVTVKAGESEGIHVHPYPRVLASLGDAEIEVRRQDGSVERTAYHLGDARYQDNTDPHEPSNVGDSDFRGVVVEFLGPPPVESKTLTDNPLDPLVAAPQFHQLVFENERVRILDVRNDPGDFEPLHEHGRSVLIILQGGTARFGLADGSKREASFSAVDHPPAGQPPQVFWEADETHSVENIGDTQIRLLRIEVK